MFQLRPTQHGQRGNALVEYVLLLTLVALAVVMGVSFTGRSISSEMGAVANELASFWGAGSGGSGGGAGSAATGAGNGQGSGGSHGHGNGNGNGGGNGGQNNGNGGPDNGSGNGK